VSDKICKSCRWWQERNIKSGVCTLNPRVWTGSWTYPTQYADDTCSHWAPMTVLAPVVKGKAKSAALP